MTPLTLFLARCFGLYCVAIAASMVVRRRETMATINAILEQPGQIMICGVIALGIGVPMIIGHNVWNGPPLTTAVTVLGWTVAAKGLMLLLLPTASLRKTYGALHYERGFVFYMVGILAAGAALLWASFRT